jgi:hypothetical protein
MAALYPIHRAVCRVPGFVTYGSPMLHRLVVTAAGAAALAAPAAAEAAPTLNPLAPCYVTAQTRLDPPTFDTQGIVLNGAGFTPYARVTVQIDGAAVATDVPVDGGGGLLVEVKSPVEPAAEHAFTVTAVEQDNPAQTVSATSVAGFLEVKATPRRARPADRILFQGRGFTQLDQPVFAHYVRRGKAKRTVRLAARPSGPCGTFSVRRRQFPFKPKVGRWTVQVDQRPAYEPSPPSTWVELSIQVRRTLKVKG